MSNHATISPAEAADRLAIRELVEAYARCADRRDAKGQMSLFTADSHFVVYMNAKNRQVDRPLSTLFWTALMLSGDVQVAEMAIVESIDSLETEDFYTDAAL